MGKLTEQLSSLAAVCNDFEHGMIEQMMHTNLHMCIGDLPQRLLRSDSPTDRQTGSCAQP